MLLRKKSKKSNFAVSEVCISKVSIGFCDHPIHDSQLIKLGRKGFKKALKRTKSLPNVKTISKNEVDDFQEVYAVRSFAGCGNIVKISHGGRNETDLYTVLYGYEVFKKDEKRRWITYENGNLRRYKSSSHGEIPKVAFDYTATGQKESDGHFENPEVNYYCYFAIV